MEVGETPEGDEIATVNGERMIAESDVEALERRWKWITIVSTLASGIFFLFVGQAL